MYKYLFNQKTLFKTIYLTKINKKKKKTKSTKKALCDQLNTKYYYHYTIPNLLYSQNKYLSINSSIESRIHLINEYCNSFNILNDT